MSVDCIGTLLGSRQSSQLKRSERSRPPSFQLPYTLEVTFTKQVSKKNKVFSEGKLHVAESLNLRITNEFDQFVGSADLGSNCNKRILFCQQYTRAIGSSEGLIQGVFEGVILHVDCPPLLIGLVEDVTMPPGPGVAEELEFQPASEIVMISDSKATHFVPVSSVDELMTLRKGPSVAGGGAVQADGWRLRILNRVYKEVFDAVNNNSKVKKQVSLGTGWRLERPEGGKRLFLVPPSVDNQQISVDLFLVVIGGVEALFKPVGDQSDYSRRIEVTPFSREAVGIVGLSKIACIRGIVNLQSLIDLVSEIRSNSCFGDIFFDLPQTQFVKGEFDEGTELGSSELLTRDQLQVVDRVSNWFTKDGEDSVVSVHGVFGSGKATVIAASVLCIVKQLERMNVPDWKILILTATSGVLENVMRKVGNGGRVVGKILAEYKQGERFQFVIIAEANGMDELHAVYALLKSRPMKIILFGDIANRKSNSHSIQQFVERYCVIGEKIIELTTQFRCREEIAEMCNYLLYKNGGESVATHSSVKERNSHLNSNILAPPEPG